MRQCASCLRAHLLGLRCLRIMLSGPLLGGWCRIQAGLLVSLPWACSGGEGGLGSSGGGDRSVLRLAVELDTFEYFLPPILGGGLLAAAANLLEPVQIRGDLRRAHKRTSSSMHTGERCASNADTACAQRPEVCVSMPLCTYARTCWDCGTGALSPVVAGLARAGEARRVVS